MKPNRILSKVLFILLFPGSLFSGECGKGKIFAVLVGVSNYKNPSLKLNYCDDDASAVYNVLVRHTDKANITLLTNETATKETILDQLQIQFSKAGPADRILFFFSGHGGDNYFLPWDASESTADNVAFEEIKAIFHLSKAGSKFLIADACMSGSIRQKEEKGNSDFTEEMLAQPQEVVVITSSRNEQLSEEMFLLQHGLFTFYLLKGIRGASDKNKDRVITIKELFNYLYINVKVDSKGKQVPVAWGKFKSDLPVLCW